ncbi:MAG: hypothetical protein ACJAUG_000389 [Halioglobus sp.]
MSSIILSTVGLILVPFREEILDSLFGLFLPGDWLASIHMANNALFEKIGNVLLFQSVAIVCFSAVSLFFFPFRDRISVLAERQITGQSVGGQGLRRELWLEAGLVIIVFNVYSASYLFAYFIGQPWFGYIDELAFALLTLFFILDLLSPTYFRRSMNCLFVLRVLRERPIQLLLFGIVFCSPIFALELVLGDLVLNQANDFVLAAALTAIIVLNCIVCVFALPLGTWLALRSIEDKQLVADHRRKAAARHRSFFGVQMLFSLGLLLFYGSVIAVLSTKVPLKSADYDIHWTTLAYEQGVEGTLPRLRFDMQISNRHESLGLKVENANLLLNLEGRYLGEATLNIPYVAPKTAVIVPVDVSVKLDFSELASIASDEIISFFKREEAAWSDNIQARLMVQLPLGLQLPIYIPGGYRHKIQEENLGE